MSNNVFNEINDSFPKDYKNFNILQDDNNINKDIDNINRLLYSLDKIQKLVSILYQNAKDKSVNLKFEIKLNLRLIECFFLKFQFDIQSTLFIVTHLEQSIFGDYKEI
ncbi:hypothetical protein RhiirA4_550696 [Rhizophagus irregularis]|uniref:Uncharacterized protein n=1 Tax=Rhizophagus irregularis TaxID=588596 RepID=A0A2I1HNX9_9GLOM|nr:hypothetical protein RhiirA4_550696 [Rhizophagus irregularis]